MTQLHIGNTIRELRKKKGITQETLAATLSVSPQAVSKWESNLTYPDMAMIPAIARYFGISLDVLFGYDAAEIKEKVKKLEEDACKACGNDYQRYVEIIKDALHDYPDNEDLLYFLLDVYTGFNTKIDGRDHLDEAIAIADKILAESSDHKLICRTKDRQARAYLEKGEYDRAKAIYESLPAVDEVPTKYKSMAFNLTGKDKLNSAVWYRCGHLQELYIACMMEGDAWYAMEQCLEVSFRDSTPEDYIPEAMKCYSKGLAVLELFLGPEYDGQDRYLWDGMQTFHWSFHQRIAACRKRLGQSEACEKEIEEAYRIVSASWKDFNENREYYMEPFNQCLKEYGLEEYVK